MTNQKTAMIEDWRRRIELDYGHILSPEIVQGTIKYWEDFIESERRKAVEEFKEKLMNIANDWMIEKFDIENAFSEMFPLENGKNN